MPNLKTISLQIHNEMVEDQLLEKGSQWSFELTVSAVKRGISKKLAVGTYTLKMHFTAETYTFINKMDSTFRDW